MPPAEETNPGNTVVDVEGKYDDPPPPYFPMRIPSLPNYNGVPPNVTIGIGPEAVDDTFHPPHAAKCEHCPDNDLRSSDFFGQPVVIFIGLLINPVFGLASYGARRLAGQHRADDRKKRQKWLRVGIGLYLAGIVLSLGAWQALLWQQYNLYFLSTENPDFKFESNNGILTPQPTTKATVLDRLHQSRNKFLFGATRKSNKHFLTKTTIPSTTTERHSSRIYSDITKVLSDIPSSSSVRPSSSEGTTVSVTVTSERSSTFLPTTVYPTTAKTPVLKDTRKSALPAEKRTFVISDDPEETYRTFLYAMDRFANDRSVQGVQNINKNI